MKIVKLYAENIKRLKAVSITPDDNIVTISGQNDQGKTSCLDAIWLAIEYAAASKSIPVPLRSGTDKGVITVDLGDYIITRKFSDGGTTSLEIKTPDGNKVSSPQKLLDGFTGYLSLDPWAFSRKTEKEQLQILGDILFAISNGKINLAEYDRQYKEVYEKRTEVNREKKRLETLLTGLRTPAATDPTEEKSFSDIAEQLNRAIEYDSLMEEFNRISKRLAEIGPGGDVNALRAQIKDIDSNNKRAREVTEYNKIKDSLIKVSDEVSTLNEKLELIDIERAEALELSPLPVEGLKITVDGIMSVTADGHEVPLCQDSSAKRFKLSLAIAMAANPKLRVILVKDASLLDDNCLKIIEEMAAANDYQIWMEKVSSDKIGIHIEDGVIV